MRFKIIHSNFVYNSILVEGQCKSHKFPLLPEGRIGGVAGMMLTSPSKQMEKLQLNHAGLLTSTLLLFCGGLNSNKQVSFDF